MSANENGRSPRALVPPLLIDPSLITVTFVFFPFFHVSLRYALRSKEKTNEEKGKERKREIARYIVA